MRLLKAALISLFCIVGATAACAQADFPNRPVRMILPYPAGGIVDIVVRIVTSKISAEWGQPIVIEAKPGANGNLAWQQVARAEPDGYTWTFYSPAVVANPRMEANAPFSEKDFVPIGGMVWSPGVLVTHPDVPVKSLKEFVEHVQKNPGKLNWAIGGVGTSYHFNSEIFFRGAKVEFLKVPYRGQPPAIPDLVTGRIQAGMFSPTLLLQYIKEGKLRALAVIAKNRLPELPDVPTMAEAGYPDTNVVAWYGLSAPKGTPKAIVDKIIAGVNAALRDPDVRTSLQKQMTEVMAPATAAELQALVDADVLKYGKIIEEAGIKLNP